MPPPPYRSLSRLPPGSIALGVLVGLMSAVFICQHWLGLWSTSVPTADGLQTWPWGYTSLHALRMGRVWTLFTYAFVHGSLLHLVTNMIPLVHFGRHLTSLLGVGKTTLIFFLASLGGAILEMAMGAFFHRPISLLGASAGVCGVLAAHMSLFPRDLYSFWLLREEVEGRRFFAGFALFSLIAGLADYVFGWQILGMNIAHFAHLGGLIVGWVAIRLWRYDGAIIEEDATKLRLKRLIRESQTLFEGNESEEEPRPKRKKEATFVSPSSTGTDSDEKAANAREEKERIDRLLEKIHEQGMESLTSEERTFLKDFSQRPSQEV